MKINLQLDTADVQKVLNALHGASPTLKIKAQARHQGVSSGKSVHVPASEVPKVSDVGSIRVEEEGSMPAM